MSRFGILMVMFASVGVLSADEIKPPEFLSIYLQCIQMYSAQNAGSSAEDAQVTCKPLLRDLQSVFQETSPSVETTIASEGLERTKTASDHYFNLMAGYGVISSKNTDNFPAFGGRIGVGLFDTGKGIASLGAYFGKFSDTVTLSGVQATQSISGILGEFIVRQAFRTGLYGGIRLGIGILDLGVEDANNTDISGGASGFVYGAAIGYEVPFSDAYAFNIDISHLTMTDTRVTIPNIVSVKIDSIGAFLFQGGLTIRW